MRASASVAALLVLATLPLGGADTSAAGPLFQGRGSASYWGPLSSCDHLDAVITVEGDVAPALATVTLRFPTSCPVDAATWAAALPLAAGGATYLLVDGSWRTGFGGFSGLSTIEIGPYGEGTDIFVELCYACATPSAGYVSATVADMRLA